MPHRIYIEPTTIRGERGQYYRVHYKGAVLIDETRNPELEACRALLSRGIVGRLEIWRFGKDHSDMLIPDIAKAAECTVEENEKRGPRFVQWTRPDDAPWNAVYVARKGFAGEGQQLAGKLSIGTNPSKISAQEDSSVLDLTRELELAK
jgi:hypothetical protein